MVASNAFILTEMEKRAEERVIQKGKIEDILEILEELGDVPEDLRETISIQTDIEKLKKWIKLASRSESLEDFKEKMNS